MCIYTAVLTEPLTIDTVCTALLIIHVASNKFSMIDRLATLVLLYITDAIIGFLSRKKMLNTVAYTVNITLCLHVEIPTHSSSYIFTSTCWSIER